jgi:hypothetical protein
MKLEFFFDRFSENTQISNFVKIRSVGAGLFHVDRHKDGQTDMTKPRVAFRSVSKGAKKGWE